MSGKNLIVGQSGGPTAVINSSLYGVVSEARRHPGDIDHIYGMENGIEGFLNDTILDFEQVLPGDKLDALIHTGRLPWFLPLQAAGVSGRPGLPAAFQEV